VTARVRRAAGVDPGTTSNRRRGGAEGGDCGLASKRTGKLTKVTPTRRPSTPRFRIAHRNRSTGNDLISEISSRSGPIVAAGPGPHVTEARVLQLLVDPHGCSRELNPYKCPFELERHRGALEILVLLDSEGPVSKSRLRSRLRPGPEALNAAIQGLVGLGLVEARTNAAFPFESRLKLTRRGGEVLATPLRMWPSLLVQY
jgi:hypothetical protein